MSPQRPSPKCEKGRTGLWRACPGAPVHLFVDHDSDITQNWDESSALLFGLFSRSKSSLCGGPWRPSQLKVKVRTFFAEVEFLSRDASGRCVCVCVCVCAQGSSQSKNPEESYSWRANEHTHTPKQTYGANWQGGQQQPAGRDSLVFCLMQHSLFIPFTLWEKKIDWRIVCSHEDTVVL